MMSGTVTRRKFLAQLFGLVLELREIIFANLTDALIGQQRFQHLQRCRKVFLRQVVNVERNLVFRHARTDRVRLVHGRSQRG